MNSPNHPQRQFISWTHLWRPSSSIISAGKFFQTPLAELTMPFLGSLCPFCVTATKVKTTLHHCTPRTHLPGGLWATAGQGLFVYHCSPGSAPNLWEAIKCLSKVMCPLKWSPSDQRNKRRSRSDPFPSFHLSLQPPDIYSLKAAHSSWKFPLVS